MNIRAPLVADGQPTKVVEPGQGPLDHPPMAAQPFARVNAAAGNPRADAALATCPAASQVVIPFVRVQLVRTLAWTSSSPAQGRDGVQRDAEHQRIMHIGARDGYGEGDASALDHNMALRARFATVRWIRPGRFAPFFAATLALSRAARDQSILSASASRWSRSRCKRSQTPAWRQSRSRRQQVIPLPQPSSWGSSSQLLPLLRTKMMPVSAARSLMRGRPPRGLGDSTGSNGSMTAQSSSLTSGLLMPPVYHWFC
jgi:hypothetical protein